LTAEDRARLAERLAATWRVIALQGVEVLHDAMDLAERSMSAGDVAAWECEISTDGWVSSALEVAEETLADLRGTELAPPGACGAPLERRCEFWLGRLEGALAGLTAALRGDLNSA
jgi:hypothetical protein